MPDLINIKQIQLSDGMYDVEALHFKTSTLDTPAEWKAYIDDIAKIGFKIEVLATLPEANETNYNKYKQSLVLVPDATAIAGAYEEYVILDKGSGVSPRYVWEKIGSTQTDLSAYAKKTEAGAAGTYTSTLSGAGDTSELAASSATGTVTISYSKANSATEAGGSISTTTGEAGAGTSDNTELAGGATVNFANATFTGTSATISVSGDAAVLNDHTYVPEGTIASTYTAASKSDAVTSVSAELAATPTFAGDTATLAHTVSAASFEGVAATLTISGSIIPEGTISDVSVGNHTHAATQTVAASNKTTVIAGLPNFDGGSATFTQGAKASLTYTDTNKAPALTGATVDANGVLSWSSDNFSTDGSAISAWSANGDDSFIATPASLGTASTASVLKSLPSITIVEGGSFTVTPTFTGTTSAFGASVTYTPSGTVTVTIADHSFVPTGAVSKPSITVAATTAKFNTDAIKAVNSIFTGTTATITHSFTDATTAAAMTGTYTPAGAISGTQSIAAHSHGYTKPAAHSHTIEIAAHTHAIGSTATQVSGTVEVTIAAHKHTIDNHTHNTTIPAISAS